MNVLIACEESQRVCTEFRKLGHRAFSCDILECSGGHEEWHIMGDCLPLLNGNCTFITMDGKYHTITGAWDIIIAHPPCTYLTCAGNSWFNVEKYGEKAIQRMYDREDAVNFFMKFTETNCKHVAIENPVGVMSTRYRKPEQIIQPWQFGHPERKGTCLWLTGLPNLEPTEIVEPIIIKTGKRTDSLWHIETWNLPAKERSRARSKTFPGIAEAMAKQWGSIEL